MKNTKLGVIGLSKGNGHPYSWSAICNGYNEAIMARCPFPVIPEYLSQQSFPEAKIPNVQVTHIWTQDKKVSSHVALASYIADIVAHPEDMIGKVDAVLLARDDAQNHLAMAKPFLEAGLPIYIDKPLAFTVKTAQEIYSLEQYPGQIFTCSALRFAPELSLSVADKKSIGKIQYVEAQVSKDWLKYGIHIIEPVVQLLDSKDEIVSKQLTRKSDTVTCEVIWKSGVKTLFKTRGAENVPITITVNGQKASVTLQFRDTFTAFKNALLAFITHLPGTKESSNTPFVLKTIDIVGTYYEQ